MIYLVILVLQILLAYGQNSNEPNCTAVPCIAGTTQRQWPKFDFDFYRDPRPATPLEPPPTSLPTVSEINSTHISPTPSTSGNSESVNPTKAAPTSDAANCIPDEAFKAQIEHLDWLQESFLLRSIFREPPPETTTKRKRSNLTEHFRKRLLRLYRLGNERQRSFNLSRLKKQQQQQQPNLNSLGYFDFATNDDNNNNNSDNKKRRKRRRASPPLNITIWDLQSSKTAPDEIDVVYLLTRDHVPVPYEDAAKLLSFVERDTIQNTTGYTVVHKVLRYDRKTTSALIASSSMTWNWLLILCAILLLILILIGLWICFCTKNRDPIGSFHQEISRLSRSRERESRSRRDSRLRDSSHQNLGLETSDSEVENSQQPPPLPRIPPPPSLHRIDQSSQASLSEPIYSKPSLLTPIARNLPSRSGTYPVNPNPDYDRISYIKTRETIEEKRKPPNIVEVQMSKETQSIVKEIRNELNRYNFKKVLNGDVETTSEA